MLPQLTVGLVSISTYWLSMAVGAVSMAVLMFLRKKRFRLGTGQAVLFSVILLICGLSGTKLLYILENWRKTLEHGVTIGGLSFFGAVFLIPVVMPLVGTLFGMKPGETLDACAPCVLSILALVRFGCFLNGCCGGWRAELGPLSFVWPTQAMESICDFMLLFFLLRLEENRRFAGKQYAVMAVSYSSVRFLIEFFRDTTKDWLYLSHGQWFALICIVIGALCIRFTRR